MGLDPVFFILFAGMAIGFALNVVLRKSPVTSAFSLVMVFFCFGAIYAIMGAHLIATFQVLVYAGAIMVLFIFVIMLLKADEPSLDMGRTSHVFKGAVLVACVALAMLLIKAFHDQPASMQKGIHTAEKIQAAGGNTRALSQLVFSDYLLPFELTSVLLLAAIVGSVSIAKRRAKNG